VQTAKNKKVALYARVSTEKQEKGLEAQQRALEEYCKTRSIDDFVLFSDEAVSGAKSSRPGLNKMMIDVRAGKIRSVVVYSFSRFARSTTHLLDTLEEFRKLEVTFVSLTENIDTNGPMGKLIFTIFAAIAEFERELIRERVRNGLKNARAKGKQLGRPSETAQHYDEVHALHDQGLTYRKIARQLGISMSAVVRALGAASRACK
jgi:DNA invertase Pin-like site-specific DNA recombinase